MISLTMRYAILPKSLVYFSMVAMALSLFGNIFNLIVPSYPQWVLFNKSMKRCQ